MTSSKLVDEVTKWPRGAYDDCVMSQWFCASSKAPNLMPPKTTVLRLWRPSWVAQAG